MVNFTGLLLAAGDGLSGQTVRGMAENAPEIPASSPEGVASTDWHSVEETVRQAGDLIYQTMDLAGRAINQAVDAVSDKAFESAANVGPNIANQAQQIGQSSFSWGGYFQAIGILCLLLALLWFAVWCIRRYGKFNFMPRPGSLPKKSLYMEAQMPLGPKKGIMVVRFLNRRLLLGVTDQQITLLTEEDARDERRNFESLMDDSRSADNSSGHISSG